MVLCWNVPSDGTVDAGRTGTFDLSMSCWRIPRLSYAKTDLDIIGPVDGGLWCGALMPSARTFSKTLRDPSFGQISWPMDHLGPSESCALEVLKGHHRQDIYIYNIVY